MRTTINIDDALLAKAIKFAGTGSIGSHS